LPAHLDHGLVVAGHLRYERGVDRPLTIGGGVCRLLRAGLTLDEDLDVALGALREAVAADLDGPADLRRGRRSARLHVLALPGRARGPPRAPRRPPPRRPRPPGPAGEPARPAPAPRRATPEQPRAPPTPRAHQILLYGSSLRLHSPVISSGPLSAPPSPRFVF